MLNAFAMSDWISDMIKKNPVDARTSNEIKPNQPDNTIDLKKLSNKELFQLLGEHDCHLSEMDGCDCVDIWDELRRRNTITFSTIL